LKHRGVPRKRGRPELEKLEPEIKGNIEEDEISRAEEVDRKTLRELLAGKAEWRRRVEVELVWKGNTKTKKMEVEDPLTLTISEGQETG